MTFIVAFILSVLVITAAYRSGEHRQTAQYALLGGMISPCISIFLLMAASWILPNREYVLARIFICYALAVTGVSLILWKYAEINWRYYLFILPVLYLHPLSIILLLILNTPA